MLSIITHIKDKTHFFNLLENNPGVIIIKFGAEWCNPCKIIENDVNVYFNSMPDNVQCIILDIDDNINIYGYLKTKKMVNGIPTILAYFKYNNDYVPDEFITGTNPIQLKKFFDICSEHANNML